MKLLILTQKIDENDDVLGFMHGWIAQFSRHCDEIVAIGLSVGDHHLPPNTRVFSLGKERGVSRLTYVLNFYRLIIRERAHYDAVFVHMNQIYILLGGMIWRMMKKKVGLWYAHGHSPLPLRFAIHGCDMIFTSTASGFRIPTSKRHIVGQGIDTERFSLIPHVWKKNDPFRVIVVGRISPVKDYETLLRAFARLKKQQLHAVLDVVGGASVPEHKIYFNKLRALARELGVADTIVFHGAVPNVRIAELLARAHCFVNTSRTGSFDKAIGEAMATGLPALTSNEAFKDVFGDCAEELMFPVGDDEALAGRIRSLMQKTDEERELLGGRLRSLIENNHSLSGFVKKIISYYE